MSFLVFVCVILTSLCNCSDVFHEGSKIALHPNYPADFFGYSVAFHETSLLVGAPKAKGKGDVFSCSLQNLETGNINCMPLRFRYKDQKHKFFRDDTWFGASIAVGPTGKVLICAPRWSDPYSRDKPMHLTTSNGACYLRTKRLEEFIFPASSLKQRFYPSHKRNNYSDHLLTDNYGRKLLEFFRYAQAGMATKITEGNIIIGAPGLMEWAGGIVQYMYNSDVNSIKISQYSTYNPYFIDDIGPNEYFGYSVESGVFEDGGSTLYVIGGPRGKRGFGSVLVIEPPTQEMAPPNILAKLEGPQLGAYFGASLSCLDINGDGRADLLVGAPNHVKWLDRDAFFDQGAVFVYLNKEQAKGFTLEYAGAVTGSETNGAKFGYGIADLGDIDADGYNDVVISAPWENNGVGAVYIYRGSKEGLKSQYLQRIVVSDAKGFGMGLTRGNDVDNNQCNDLAVGAHDSSKAYIYRCIPSVKVQSTIKIPEMLNLPQNTTNFTAQFCISVTHSRMHRTAIVMEFVARVSVDRGDDNRATIASNSTYQLTATVPYDNCDGKIIEIKPAADLSRPIAITFDVESVDRMQENPTHFITNAGRVSTDSTTHSEFDIQLARDCGEDLICKPWLVMTLEAMKEPFIPGAEGRLGATIKVLNIEEPAFGIRLNLTLPSSPKRLPRTCNLQGLNMTCELPSPLNRNQTAEWDVEFEYTQDMREMGVTMISAVMDDPVIGRNISDHASQYLEITIKPVASISARGRAFPNATLTVTRDMFTTGGYIPFIHNFQVINAGPSDLSDLRATILASESCKKVSLASEIAGCDENEVSASLTLSCTWSVRAKEFLSVGLPLRFDLATNGEFLDAGTVCNITTSLFLYQDDDKVTVVTVSTTLVLEPAPPYWIAIIVGSVVGLLLLAIISYTTYKCGYLSRKRHPDYNKLPSGTADEKAGCSSSFRSSQLSTAAIGSEVEHLKSGCSDSPQSSQKLASSNASSEEDLTKPGCSTNIHSSLGSTPTIGSTEDLSISDCPTSSVVLASNTASNKVSQDLRIKEPIKFSELAST